MTDEMKALMALAEALGYKINIKEDSGDTEREVNEEIYSRTSQNIDYIFTVERIV